MSRPLRCSLLLCVQLILFGCTKDPTTILLKIEAEAGLPLPDELRLSVFSEPGTAVADQRLPESGTPRLPDDVVLYPKESEGVVRLLVRALVGGGVVGEGATSVTLEPHQQVEATVTIASGALPDRDKDGVPDLVDNCPDLPNPDQGPCGGPDGGGDAGVDARADTGPEPDTLDCDQDKDGHRALSCGGGDCDDTRADVNPDRVEGPVGHATCQDGLDNDCDGSTDLVDTNCKTCTTDSECDDKNICTADRCTGGACDNAPANEGLDCDDSNACTTNTSCQSGTCGGSAVVCPPPASTCKTASCDPSQGCVFADKPDGTSCSDGLYCTVSDSCNSGVCQSQPRDCAASAPACQTGSCDESQKQCIYSPVQDGTTCDDGDPCTQGESCQNGACTAPPLLVEDAHAINITRRNDRSLALDSKGALHTVHYHRNNTALHYATNASGSWQNEVVDASSPDIGTWASIAIDAQDQIYIVYTDETKAKTTIAVRTAPASAWQISQIHDGQGHNSVAVDSSGTLHVSFQDDGELYYTVGKPNQWKHTKVDVSGSTTVNVGYHSSLALDGQGKVHIAHGEGTTSTSPTGTPWDQITTLRYSTNAGAGGSWSTVTPAASSVTVTGDHGGFASLAATVTGSGVVHITHSSSTLYSDNSATLYHTTNKGGAWKTEIVGPPQNAGSFSSILLDSQGNAHVAFRNPSTNQMRHATNASGTWVVQLIDGSINGSNGWASIVQHGSGRIHLTYEHQNNKVRHAAFSACP